MAALALVALIFGVYVCVVYIYNTSKSIKPWGVLNAIGTAHYAYPKTTIPVAISPARRKPSAWRGFFNPIVCMIGFVTIISVFPVLYVLLAILFESIGYVPYLPLVMLCLILMAPIGYAVIFFLHFGIAAVIFSVTMLILKIMNKKIPAGKIYRTAVYASAPMIMVNACTCLKYSSLKFDYFSIAITAGLMFFAIKYILKKQESKYIYISAAIRQHIRQHGFIHAAF